MSRSGVTIPKHPYSRDEQSGAGNCWCGRPETSRIHPEHVAVVRPDLHPHKCICGWPAAEHIALRTDGGDDE